MALDRQSVIRTDFPMSRRGYDRIAVDRHLDEIAQQLDGIERPVSVGATTSAHVQSILDAAEASAAEIERRAWDDASRVQDEADQALARARTQVQALAAASRSLRERLDGLLTEVEALEGNLAEPGLRSAEAEPMFDPQDTMAFDPIAEDVVAAQTPPPAPAESRFGREVPATDHRTGRPGGARERQARRAEHGRRRAAARGHRRVPRRSVPRRRARSAPRRDLPRPLAAQQALRG